MINFRATSNFVLNSYGDRMCWTIGFWVLGDSGDAIHVEFVEVLSGMLFWSWEGKTQCGVYYNVSSIGICFIGNSLFMVFMYSIVPLPLKH